MKPFSISVPPLEPQELLKVGGLSWLVEDHDEFLHEYWTRKPLLRHGPSEKFLDLITVSQLDDLISFQNIREPYFRMSSRGRAVQEKRFMKEIDIQGRLMPRAVDVNKVASEFAHGATLLLDSIDHYVTPIRALCDRLRRELGAPSEAVAIVTPPNADGLTPHQDNAEVFVLQVHGRKKWKVYSQIRPLVTNGEVFRASALGKPIEEVILQPGDFLYIPWGSPHSAVACDDVSVHLSITLRPPTLADIVTDLIEIRLQEVPYSPLPIADQNIKSPVVATVAANMLEHVFDATQMKLASEEYVRDLRGVPEKRAGFLQQVGRLSTLAPESMLFVDHLVAFKVVESSEVRVLTDGRAYRYPMTALPALRIIESSDGPVPFSALIAVCQADIARSIVESLVVNGVLRVI